MSISKALLPELEDYLSVLPNDSDEVESKEVDVNGNILPDEDQENIKSTRDDKYWWDTDEPSTFKYQQRLPGRCSANLEDQPVETITTGKIRGTMEQPKICPVYCDRESNGVRHFSAYITGPISDVDDYIDLIDTLLIANKEDTFDIFIDSPGGLIASGSFISSAIYHSHATVRTISRGMCASAGALVHSAPRDTNNAISKPTSIHMYHMSSHCDYGYSTHIASRADQQVRYVNECLLVPALEAGHISKEEFDRIQAGDEIYISGTRFSEHQTQILEAIKSSMSASERVAGNASFTREKVTTPSQLVSPIPFFITAEEFYKNQELCDGRSNPRRDALLVRTHDQKNFRVYMKSAYDFNKVYVGRICRFLDSRRPGETVSIILGTRMDDMYSATNCGAIVDAISSCKAKVITIAAGWCSIGETFLWMFGHQRIMMKYGGLTFNVPDIVKWYPEHQLFFGYLLAKGIELKIITQEDIDTILKTRIDKQILECDYRKLFPQN